MNHTAVGSREKAPRTFPLSSPTADDTTSFRPHLGTTPSAPSNPFLRSSPFCSQTDDGDDSEPSSGADEFHLERYTQDTDKNAQQTRNRGRQASQQAPGGRSPARPKRRRRPGLNVVTDLHTQAQRAQAVGVVIEEVKRPHLGIRKTSSVVSAKAEHVNHSTWERPPPIAQLRTPQEVPTGAYATGKDAQWVSEGARGLALTPGGAHRPSAGTDEISPDVQSVIIGLSMPQGEMLAHHDPTTTNSATWRNPPQTPAIVVTPADETHPQTFPRGAERRRASSLYSFEAPTEKQWIEPDRHLIHRVSGPGPTVEEGATSTVVRATVGRPHARKHREAESWAEEGEFGDESPRRSFESGRHILDEHVEDQRPQSKGWWNLMLSPVLSRKGTVLARHDAAASGAVPPVPMPDPEHFKTGLASPLSTKSPGTPRQLDLPSVRETRWPRWTTWLMGDDLAAKDDVHDAIPASNAANDSVRPKGIDNLGEEVHGREDRGLAAEYYLACAFDQLREGPYFKCRNHSCAENLPQLRSVFDPTPVTHSGRGRVMALSSESFGDGAAKAEDAHDPDPQSASALKETSIGGDGKEAYAVPPLGSNHAPFADHIASERGDPVSTTGELASARFAARETYAEHHAAPSVLSPGPISPATQRAMASPGAVAMSEMDHPTDMIRAPAHAHGTQTPSDHTQTRSWDFSHEETTLHGHEALAQSPTGSKDASRRAMSPTFTKSTEKKKHDSWFSKLRHFFRRKKPSEGSKRMATKKKRWTLILSGVLLVIVIACVLAATLITRAGDKTPVQQQWLNLTGYPPLPTGISTIAQPDHVQEQSGCVAPTTLWSCALPKEDQFQIAPNNPDQPNFRFQITFENGTVPTNMTIPKQDLVRRARAIEGRATDPFTQDLFQPNPAPPSRADQIFMGNTTDNITSPFQGEPTPFFITFIPVFPVDPSNITAANASISARLRARQAGNSSSPIPPPDVLDDGSAAPANLLPTSPYPASQPLNLYNRGRADEHYGFYMYYDKAIFLRSTAPLNSSQVAVDGGVDPADQDGGATRDQARVRCTFSQTRFLVRIWTSPSWGATLLAPSAGSNETDTRLGTTSATDFHRPGSFPYPATISIDRHGGNINKKAAYCYGVDELQVIQVDDRSAIPELRGVGGSLINAAPPLVEGPTGDDGFDPEAGGIDGGTGGCGCVWQNWS